MRWPYIFEHPHRFPLAERRHATLSTERHARLNFHISSEVARRQKSASSYLITVAFVGELVQRHALGNIRKRPVDGGAVLFLEAVHSGRRRRRRSIVVRVGRHGVSRFVFDRGYVIFLTNKTRVFFFGSTLEKVTVWGGVCWDRRRCVASTKTSLLEKNGNYSFPRRTCGLEFGSRSCLAPSMIAW